MSNKKKIGFFGRMTRSANPGFEITMFTVSIAIALAVLVAVVWIGYYYYKGQVGRFNADDVGSVAVSDSAVEVDEDEPVESPMPDGDVFINEDDLNDFDPDLKDATYAYTTSDVNLRSEPSLTATVIAKVPLGAVVDMIEYDGNEWAKVSYQGTQGYINARYLSTTKPVPIPTVAPVVSAEPSATPAPATETPIPEETEMPDPPEPTDEPDPTEAPPTETPQVTEEPTEVPVEEPTEVPVEPVEE